MMPNHIHLKTYDLFTGYRPLIHGFSTRAGGYSESPFLGLNLGLTTPDRHEHILKNRQVFFDALNIAETQCVIPKQIHSANVCYVEEPGIVPDCDALITDKSNLFLTVQTADCFPVFIFDPIHHSIGLVHSGWRGTAQGVVPKTLESMHSRFDTNPADCLVVVGPGVQQNCYQVDEETAKRFSTEFLKPDGPGHFLLDVRGTILNQLDQLQISRTQIEFDTSCTHCSADLYFSYRRDGQYSGRMMGILGLAE